MIVKWEMIRYIPNISFFLVILLLATFKGCESIGSCTKDGAVVATVQQEKAVLGSKQDGFRVKCDYTILDNTHTFALWRLRKTTTDFILSYIPSVNPSVVEGTNYNGRNLDFQDNSAVFPDYSCSDVAFLNLTCVLQLDGFTITCNDEMEQNIFATPNVTGVTFNPSQNVAVGTNVELTITAEDYKCFESPTFSVQIGNGEATPLVVTETSSGCFSSFTSTVTVTAASGNVKVNMMCGGDTETVDSGVAVPISGPSSSEGPPLTTTPPPKPEIPIWAIIVIALIIPIIVVVVVVVYCVCKHRKSKTDEKENNGNVESSVREKNNVQLTSRESNGAGRSGGRIEDHEATHNKQDYRM